MERILSIVRCDYMRIFIAIFHKVDYIFFLFTQLVMKVVHCTLHGHTGTTGVLGPGFWGTRRLAKLAVGYSKTPAPERPVVPVCKISSCKINRLALELFYIEERRGLYKKRWQLQIFLEMFLKCFMVRSIKIKGLDRQLAPT